MPEISFAILQYNKSVKEDLSGTAPPHTATDISLASNEKMKKLRNTQLLLSVQNDQEKEGRNVRISLSFCFIHFNTYGSSQS